MSSIVSYEDYLKLPREPETWLIHSLFPSGGAVSLYGDAKAGKSFLALQIASAISDPNRRDFFGFPVDSHGDVVYLQFDTPRSLWAQRLSTLSGPVETVKFADRESLGAYPFDILNNEHCNILHQSLNEVKPVLVILDTLREAHSGDENDSTAMRNVVNALTAVVSPAALLIIAHSRKPSTDKDGKSHFSVISDQRGSNYVAGRMDTIMRLTTRDHGHTGRLYVAGRAFEEGFLELERMGDGTWSLTKGGEVESAILSTRTGGGTEREQARHLATQLGITEDAARMRLRRD